MVLAFEYQYLTRFHTLERKLFPDAYWVLSKIGRSGWGWEATDNNFIVDAVYIALPKLYAEDGNIANCVFLAINPDSGKRDEALAKYLSQNGDCHF